MVVLTFYIQNFFASQLYMLNYKQHLENRIWIAMIMSKFKIPCMIILKSSMYSVKKIKRIFVLICVTEQSHNYL